MRLVLILLLSLAALPARAGWRDEVLYFVMLDRFANGDPGNDQDVDRDNPLAFQGGDLAGLAAQLPEIADLGATALWISPLALQIDHPIDSEGRAFYPHHGYWAEDFRRIDPRFGTEAQLKALVDKAHALGLKVVLDVVYNHLGYGAGWTRSHPEWLRQGERCGTDDVTRCLAGLPDLRTELPALREALFEAHVGLAERTGLDGFRLDTVKHVGHDFWARHAARVRARLGPDFLLLGEVWGADKYLARPYLDSGEMDALFDFGFRDHTLRFLTGVENAARYGRYLSRRHALERGFLAPFLSNHDLPMMLAMLRGDTDRLLLGMALLFSVEGMPVLAWGEAVGRRGGPWPDNRGVMPWGERPIPPGAGLARDEALRRKIQALIALRQALPALRAPDLSVLVAEGGLLVYRRGADLLVVLNRGPEPRAVTLPEGRWDVLWSSRGAPGDPVSAAILRRSP